MGANLILNFIKKQVHEPNKIFLIDFEKLNGKISFPNFNQINSAIVKTFQ